MRVASSPFVVNVSDLLARTGEERRVTLRAPLEVGVDQARTDGDVPVQADLVLRSIPGGILVTGSLTAPAHLTCYRCLTEWDEEQVVRVRELFGDGLDDDGDYRVDDQHIDLEPLVRDEVVLALPLLPLCRADCAGLCPTCGADLNTGACPGHDVASSSPFAGLRDLLETQD